jgi:hypothetical protein
MYLCKSYLTSLKISRNTLGLFVGILKPIVAFLLDIDLETRNTA